MHRLLLVNVMSKKQNDARFDINLVASNKLEKIYILKKIAI